MFIVYQIFAMLLLLAVTAASVAHHDSYGASSEQGEGWIGKYGHFEYVFLEDVCAAVMLLFAALIAWRLAAVPRSARRKTSARLAELTVFLLLLAVAALMGIEAVAEVSILGSENQQIISGWGKLSRVVAYVGTSVLFCWSAVLSVFFLMGERE